MSLGQRQRLSLFDAAIALVMQYNASFFLVRPVPPSRPSLCNGNALSHRQVECRYGVTQSTIKQATQAQAAPNDDEKNASGGELKSILVATKNRWNEIQLSSFVILRANNCKMRS